MEEAKPPTEGSKDDKLRRDEGPRMEDGKSPSEVMDLTDRSPSSTSIDSNHCNASALANDEHSNGAVPSLDEKSVPECKELLEPTVPLQANENTPPQPTGGVIENSLNALKDAIVDISDETSVIDTTNTSPESFTDDKVVRRTEGVGESSSDSVPAECVKEDLIASDIQCAQSLDSKDECSDGKLQENEESSNCSPLPLKKKPNKLESILSNLKSKSFLSRSTPLNVDEDGFNVCDEGEDESLPELPPGTIVVTPTDVDVAETAVRRKKHRKVKKHDLPLNKARLEGMINAATDIKDLCGVTDGIIDPSAIEAVQSPKEGQREDASTTLASQNALPERTNILANSNSVYSLQPAQANPVPPAQGSVQSISGTTNQPVMIGIAQNGALNNNLSLINSASTQLQLLQRQQSFQQTDQQFSSIPLQQQVSTLSSGQNIIFQSPQNPVGAQIIVQGQPMLMNQGIGTAPYQVSVNSQPMMSSHLQAPILTSHLQQTKFGNQQQYGSNGLQASSSPQIVPQVRPQQPLQQPQQPLQQQQVGSSVFQATPQAQSKSQPIFVLQRGDTLKLDGSGNLVVVAREDAKVEPKSVVPLSQQQQSQQNSLPQAAPILPPLRQIPQVVMPVSTTAAVSNNLAVSPAIYSSTVSSTAAVSMPSLKPISQLSRNTTPAIISASTLIPAITQQNSLGSRLPTHVVSSASKSVTKTNSATPKQPQQGILAQALKAPQSAYLDSASGLHLAASGLIRQTNLPSGEGQALLAKLQQPQVMEAITNAASSFKSPVHLPDGTSPQQLPKQIRIVYRTSQANQVKSGTSSNEPRKVTLFSCSICTKIFLRKDSYDQHMQTHYAAFSCPKCLMKFVSSAVLARHQKVCTKSNEESNVPFSCGYCQMRFKFTRELTPHTQKCHPGKPVKALFHSSAVSNGNIKDNKATDGKTTPKLPLTLPKIKPVVLVPKSTPSTTPPPPKPPPPPQPPIPPIKISKELLISKSPEKHSLKQEREKTHSEKPKSPRIKEDRDDLWVPVSKTRKRKKFKRKKIAKYLLNDRIEPGFPKTKKISDCDDWYGEILIHKDPECTTSKLIKKHGEKKKSGKRPYLCKLCPKDFFSEHCLFEHIKIHTKPFTCGECGLRNARKDNIMKHIQLVHQGPKYKTRDKRKKQLLGGRGRKRRKLSGENGNNSGSEEETGDDQNNKSKDHYDSESELPTMVKHHTRLSRLRRRHQNKMNDEYQEVGKRKEIEEDAIDQIADLTPDCNSGDKVDVEKDKEVNLTAGGSDGKVDIDDGSGNDNGDDDNDDGDNDGDRGISENVSDSKTDHENNEGEEVTSRTKDAESTLEHATPPSGKDEEPANGTSRETFENSHTSVNDPEEDCSSKGALSRDNGHTEEGMDVDVVNDSHQGQQSTLAENQSDTTSPPTQHETSDAFGLKEERFENGIDCGKGDDEDGNMDDAIEAIDDCEFKADIIKREMPINEKARMGQSPVTDVTESGKSGEDIAEEMSEDLLPSTAITT